MEPINQFRAVIVEHFLGAMEAAFWPSVDSADLSSATLRGVLGGSRTEWVKFSELATEAQMRHIKWMLAYNPIVFHAPEVASGTRR